MVSDDELLRSLSDALKQSRRCEADLVARIAEVDARKLYARESAPSMFVYCTGILHLSEPEAYLRIAVARASRRHPVLLTMLADGRLHLSGIERLAPHLTPENQQELLKRAVHKSKRQIEELVAELAPRPGAPATIRKLPARRGAALFGAPAAGSELRPAGVAPVSARPLACGMPDSRTGPTGAVRPDGEFRLDEAASGHLGLGPDQFAARAEELRLDGASGADKVAPVQRPVVEPIAPARFRVRFDASAELRDKLERLQALMRPSVPDGDLAKIIDALVTEKLERLEAKRFAKTKKPRKGLAGTDTTPKTRHIPAPVRRAVHERDGGRCTYVDERGRRCTARHRLEFHHQEPFGRGGRHSLRNLHLVCRIHNALLAEQDYGKEVMARFRRSASRATEAAAVRGGGIPHRPRWRSPG
jgi:hypothetical protein